MKNKLLIILITLISSSCATSLERISVPIDSPDWKVGFQTRPKSFGDASNLREFIPIKDSIDNWSKLITIQYIDGQSNVPPKAFVTILIDQIKKTCPDAEWNIIESSARSIMYEWHTKACKPPANKSDPNIYTPQHEVSRIIFGNDGIHKVSYNEKTSNLNPAIREKWISNLRESKLQKNGKTIQIQ